WNASSAIRPAGRVPGAPPGRRSRRSRLYLRPSVVGRDDWDSALAVGTPGEARGVGPPAARPPGALWGCLAPHSHLRGAIRPTPRQQGLDAEEAHPGTPYWPWARLLSRVFGLDMRTCPFCRRGSLRIIAVITQEAVLTRILRHLQLASVPPPLAPARYHQACSVFD